MDMKKLAPWNWFKKENEHFGKTVRVSRKSLPAPQVKQIDIQSV